MVASPVTLVNPFVGTGGHGHTFPGATCSGMIRLVLIQDMRVGMVVQDIEVTTAVIYGFSHTI